MFRLARATCSVCILLASFGLTVVRSVHAQATFTPLGFFGGAAQSEAHDVSANGSVVVGIATNFPDMTHGVFRWTKESTTMHRPIVPREVSVSDDGTTIAGSRYLTQTNLDEAFRWIPAEGLFEGLGDFPGGAFQSSAYDVSADGSVIVGYGNANNLNRAFRWTEAGGMVDIGQGIAYGVSSDGNVVVGTGFRWTAATGMVELARLPGAVGLVAHGISPDGAVAVGAQDFRVSLSGFRSEASRWAEQGVASLAPGSHTVAADIRHFGRWLGGCGGRTRKIDRSYGLLLDTSDRLCRATRRAYFRRRDRPQWLAAH
jgi:probable HAF family extracellular repeat protein